MQEVSKDLAPSWKGKRKTLRHTSPLPRVPLSHSKWEKVAPEDRGEKHLEEKRPGKLQTSSTKRSP
ncbi:dnaJ [Symbiodinium sp. CCMP2456]|nr:dnaJ [Symbiodinium sp. CCMP2456]